MSLKILITDPKTSVEEIAAEIERIKKDPEVSKSLLEDCPSEEKPLYLAIKSQRLDILCLLLSLDCKVNKKDYEALLKNYQNQDKRLIIEAYLDFYHYLQQQGLDENIEFGRTIELIQQIAKMLEPLKEGESAVVVMGKTGSGKSTLTNALNGVIYEKFREKGRSSYLKVMNGSTPETTKTSKLLHSETSYPTLVKINDYNYIDMPGYDDSRGNAWRTAIGLCTRFLPKHFSHLQALIYVCTGADFENRSLSLLEDLDILSKVVAEDKEHIKNILLIVNKPTQELIEDGAEGIIIHIKRILTENTALSAKIKFLLQNLNEENIVIVDTPSQVLMSAIRNKISNFTAKSFSSFNFSFYNTDAKKFHVLLNRIKVYQEKIYDEIRLLRLSLFQGAMVSKGESYTKDFIGTANFFTPAKWSNIKKECDQLSAAQSNLHKKVLSLFSQFDRYSKELNQVKTGQPVLQDISYELQKRLEQKAVVDAVLEHIDIVVGEKLSLPTQKKRPVLTVNF